jgi:hypothetical protein
MSVVWEDPPKLSGRTERFGRKPSPLRQEANDMLAALAGNPGAWARLWDFEDKEDAKKRANYVGQKYYSFSVRQTPVGWSLYGRFNGEPEEGQDQEDGDQEQGQPEPEPEPSYPDPGSEPYNPDAEPEPVATEPVRSQTFSNA